MTTISKATQIKAIERVFALRSNGVTAIDAKTLVAAEFETSVYKVSQWVKQHGPKTTNTIAKTNRNSSLEVLNYSFNDMSTDIRGVLRSVVKQDGRYTTREAGVIGKLYGAELSRAKLLLEVHKHNAKISSGTTNNNTLNLS